MSSTSTEARPARKGPWYASIAGYMAMMAAMSLIPAATMNYARRDMDGLVARWEAVQPGKPALDMADELQAMLLARTGMPALPELSLMGWYHVTELNNFRRPPGARNVREPSSLSERGVMTVYTIIKEEDWDDRDRRRAYADALARSLEVPASGGARREYGLTPARTEDGRSVVYVSIAYRVSAARKSLVAPSTEAAPVVLLGAADAGTGKSRLTRTFYCTERDGSVRILDEETKKWRPAKWLRAGPPVPLHPDSIPEERTDAQDGMWAGTYGRGRPFPRPAAPSPSSP